MSKIIQFYLFSFILIFIIKCDLILDNNDESEHFFSDSHYQKYLWGTYKPNLYYSYKKMESKTPVFGLMWYQYRNNNTSISKVLRHECKKEDNIKYYFNGHNGIDYHNEIINDIDNNIKFNISNVKFENGNKQSWGTLIKLSHHSNSNNSETSVILYLSLENYKIEDKVYFKPEIINNNEFIIHKIKNGNEISKFKIDVKSSSPLIYSSLQKYRKKFEYLWKTRYIIETELENVQTKNIQNKDIHKYIPFSELGKTNMPNLIAIQLVFDKSQEAEIFVQYSNGNEDKKDMRKEFDEKLENKRKEFINKFNSIFPVRNITESDNNLSRMSIEALSNLIGGIGYLYGKIRVKGQDYEKGKEVGLLTATPCRSYFARGFLWDEGFHQIILFKWDLELSLHIILSWLETMENNGWIPREQIRGLEAEAQVPKEFISQDREVANPPSLLIVLSKILDNYTYSNKESNDYSLKQILNFIYKKLLKWSDFFENTQKSKLAFRDEIKYRYSYQWNKRNNEHNYPSGFDDLPRGMLINDEEIYLDLSIWLLELEKLLYKLSHFFDKERESYYKKSIENREIFIKEKLYSKELGIYADYLGKQFKKIKINKFNRKVFPYLWRNDNYCGPDAKNPIGTKAECNPYSDSPCCSEFGWCGNTQNHCYCEKCVKSEKLENRKEYRKLEETHNPHVGYANLFPIIFGFISPKEENIIDNIFSFLDNNNELMSEYGIRSLSKNDLLYHTGDDYWRGNIWINLNYLVLRGLYKYYINTNEKALKIYNKIRKGVINAIYNTWAKEHVFYENYADTNGLGIKNNPFNGWTSTIVNILSEEYI